jgi:hypothetical protein
LRKFNLNLLLLFTENPLKTNTLSIFLVKVYIVIVFPESGGIKLGKIEKTNFEYVDEKLDDLGIKFKMPRKIETFIRLDRQLEIPGKEGETCNEVCVSTMIDYKGGFFGHNGEAGETLTFPAKNGKILYFFELTNMPTEFHEKNAWAAIQKHQEVCNGIAKKY